MPSFHHIVNNKSCFQRFGIFSTQNVQRCVKEDQDYFRHGKQIQPWSPRGDGVPCGDVQHQWRPCACGWRCRHHLVLETRGHISRELWLTLPQVLLLQWLLAATGNHGNTKDHKHLHPCLPEFPGTWSCDALWQCRKSELTWYSNLNGLLSTSCTQARSYH